MAFFHQPISLKRSIKASKLSRTYKKAIPIATIAATTHIGDDMTACIFTSGSLVYGPFKKITMSSPTDADVHVLCYKG